VLLDNLGRPGFRLDLRAHIEKRSTGTRAGDWMREAQEGAFAFAHAAPVLGRAHKYARRLSRHSKKDEPLAIYAMGKEAHAPLLFIAHFQIGNSFGRLENLPQVV